MYTYTDSCTASCTSISNIVSSNYVLPSLTATNTNPYLILMRSVLVQTLHLDSVESDRENEKQACICKTSNVNTQNMGLIK